MPQTFSANALPAGTMIQEYRILDVLGAGSFGIVYKAENVYLDEVVAIKEFLPSDLACRAGGTRVVPLSSTTEEPYLWALRQFLKPGQPPFAVFEGVRAATVSARWTRLPPSGERVVERRPCSWRARGPRREVTKVGPPSARGHVRSCRR